MSEPKEGGHAFPLPAGFMLANGDTWEPVPGMTLRDYFAAKALAGMLASPPFADRAADKVNHAGWAKNAYMFADAMLKERDK